MNTWQKIALVGLLLVAGRAHAEDIVHYYYTDPQGTVLAKTDATGNAIASYDYAPYGSQALGTPPNGPGYTGHVNDPDTGLVYMQARYYDPVVGRFLSTDPVGPSAGNGFNFNRYDYANNNPIVNMDADGRETGRLTNPDGVGVAGPGYVTFVNPSVSQSSGQRNHATSNANSGRSNAGHAPMGTAGHAADAILTLVGGTAFNEMKRPNHPTKVPDKLAHELFMVNAAAVGVAASPGAIVVGGSAAPVVADGAVVVGGAAARVGANYGGRALMAGCLAVACGGEDQPYQFAEQKQALQEMYTGVSEAATDFYRVIIQSDSAK